MSPYIQAYSIIRPHQPFPSVMRLSVPIRRLAASMDFSVRSIPSPARLSNALSSSSVDENRSDDAFRALAIFRIESERASCSARWWSRMASVVAVDVLVVAAALDIEFMRRLAKRAARAVLVAVSSADAE